MNKGFGNSTQTVDQLIKNQIKQNKFLCSEVSNGFRRIYEEPMWSYIPTFRKHVSKEDVVNPYKSPLEVWEGFNADYTNPDDEFTYFTSGKCGIWFLRTFRHKEFNFYDFDICVSFKSDHLSCNPLTVESAIISSFGRSTYEDWKQVALNDLDSLRQLISAVKDRLKRPHQSVTCCERSAKLCKRVDLPIVNNFAFLIPSKFTN